MTHVAATLAHALPALRVRARHRGETLLDVLGYPGSAIGPAIGGCAFHGAVACAYEQSKRGLHLGFMGVPVGEEPAVDIGVREGAALPGDVYRVTLGDETIHGFATTWPPRRCGDVLARLPHTGHVVLLHHDPATEMTSSTPSRKRPAPHRTLRTLRALEALLADEVVNEVDGIGTA